MTRLESGPARTDALWQIGIFLAFFAFGLYFLYDWKIGWPKANREHAIADLPKFVQDLKLDAAGTYGKLGDRPTQDDFDKLCKATAGSPPSIDAVHAALGQPTLTREVTSQQFEYFLSRTGGAKIEIKDGRVQPFAPGSNWQTWYKSHEQVNNQVYWSLLPFAASLFFLKKLVTAVSLKATLDDKEMVYGGRRVAYDRIESIQDYNPKGWIDVHYRDDANARRKLRIDNEKIARFDEIVARLCAAKNVPNPVEELRRQRQALDGGAS